MRRATRRAGVRAALEAAAIPTFAGPRVAAVSADRIRFVRAPGWMPGRRRAYVIGDIHGCLDSLTALHRMIADDLAARATGSAVLIHLGDYIDHGPDSAGVIRLLTAGPPVPGLSQVDLVGDHERMLLEALAGDRAAATDWLWAGGKAALASWGLDPELPREAWPTSLPADDIAWLRGLSPLHREGSYLFVHAGIRPGVALADQAKDDLLTIRQPFLSAEQDFGVVVVHGHAGAPSVSINPNRIGLDTGAGMGGTLSCAVLEDDLIGLLAV
jgi:serine/threonine protein phosphatase 1